MPRQASHLGFPDGDPDELRAHVGEEGKDEGVDETEELAEIAGTLVRLERLAALPVTEAEPLLTRDTAEVDDEAKKDETSEGDDLDEREPEPGKQSATERSTEWSIEDLLDLAEPLDAQAVDSDDECDEDGNPCGPVDALVPVSNDERTRHDLVG